MLQEISERLTAQFSPEAIATFLGERLIPDLIVAGVTVAVFVVVGRLVLSVTDRALQRSHLDETAQKFVLAVLRTSILAIGAVTVAAQFGIDTTSILTSLGVVGLTVGFAARDTLANVISGLFIFWDRPFVLGDMVEISGEYGRVAEITMRTTRVVTPDGRMLAVPNTVVVNSMVASYTNFPNLRIEVAATVSVDAPLDRVREVLLSVVTSDDAYLDEPPPRVVVSALNDYNTEVKLQAWLRDERQHITARFALREAVFRALNDAGIEMPYETLEVRTREA